MAATFNWKEFLEVIGNTGTPTNLNMGSTIAIDLVTATFPVTAGENSFEKYIKAEFGGTFTKIDKIFFWKSAGALVTSETIKYGDTVTYTAPVTTSSSVATVDILTDAIAGAEVGIGGSNAGSLSAPGSSDFIVLQTQIGVGASAGATNTKTYSLQYDEI